MKCPKCIEQGTKSCVYEEGSSTTLMNSISYYDEDGKHIYRNPNKTTTRFKCSLGHEWTETK